MSGLVQHRDFVLLDDISLLVTLRCRRQRFDVGIAIEALVKHGRRPI